MDVKYIATTSVEDTLAERVEEFKENYQDYPELFNHYFISEGYLYIKNKDKFVKVFLDTYYGENEIKIIRHKEPNVILGIIDSTRETKRVCGKPMSGYKWKKLACAVQNLKDTPFEFDFDLGEVL